MSATTRLVAEILALLALHGPVSAYRLRQLAEARWGQSIAPPLVYRALNRLSRETRVTHLAATRRYVLSRSPAEPSLAFSCVLCGEVTLVTDPGFSAAAASVAKDLGFMPQDSSVEIVGRCSKCHDSEAPVADAPGTAEESAAIDTESSVRA